MKEYLTDQYNFLEEADLDTLNIGAQSIQVYPDSKPDTKRIKYRLHKLTVQLLKHVYERGLKHLPLY